MAGLLSSSAYGQVGGRDKAAYLLRSTSHQLISEPKKISLAVSTETLTGGLCLDQSPLLDVKNFIDCSGSHGRHMDWDCGHARLVCAAGHHWGQGDSPSLMTLVSSQEPTESHICNEQTPKMRFEPGTGGWPRSSKASLLAQQQSRRKPESLFQQSGRELLRADL